jgi:hypothetical protein
VDPQQIVMNKRRRHTADLCQSCIGDSTDLRPFRGLNRESGTHGTNRRDECHRRTNGDYPADSTPALDERHPDTTAATKTAATATASTARVTIRRVRGSMWLSLGAVLAISG